MKNVESMDYTHSHLSIIASLFGTVHCPFSPRELAQTSPVHPNPVIRYALSHISLLISSSKQPPYLPGGGMTLGYAQDGETTLQNIARGVPPGWLNLAGLTLAGLTCPG